MSFSKDVLEGLTSKRKYLSSKYFYDAIGDKLFQEIMELPEYYLTRSELEIFKNQADSIFQKLNTEHEKFDLIEFGAGDGSKTKILVEGLLENSAQFKYLPIDISNDVLIQLKNDFNVAFPGLEIDPKNTDYFSALEVINEESQNPKVVLFLGSSIGNFSTERAVEFLGALSQNLRKGDQVLIGFDLRKNPHVIIQAYNDRMGVTKAFNLNLLDRINKELDADFDLQNWDHYPYYDPETGLAKSFLVSLADQTVRINLIDTDISFEKGECVHTEISKKYSLEEIEKIVDRSGFRTIKHFFDSKHYYTDTLIQF